MSLPTAHSYSNNYCGRWSLVEQKEIFHFKSFLHTPIFNFKISPMTNCSVCTRNEQVSWSTRQRPVDSVNSCHLKREMAVCCRFQWKLFLHHCLLQTVWKWKPYCLTFRGKINDFLSRISSKEISELIQSIHQRQKKRSVNMAKY